MSITASDEDLPEVHPLDQREKSVLMLLLHDPVPWSVDEIGVTLEDRAESGPRASPGRVRVLDARGPALGRTARGRLLMPRSAEWAETTPVKTLGDLGRTIGLRRRSMGLTQQHVSGVTGVSASLVSRLELGRDETAQFRAVLLIVNVLGLDIELRPRGSKFTPRKPTKVNELGLSPDALAALHTAGIEAVDQLGSARAMLERPEFNRGSELFEIVCALNRHGLSLPINRRRIPGDRDREIFRLRIVEGLTLDQLAQRFGCTESAYAKCSHSSSA